MNIDLEEALESSFLSQEQLASQQVEYDRDAEADKERLVRSNLVPTWDSWWRHSH